MTHTRILVADANRTWCDFYHESLPIHRFEIETASTGLECLTRLKEHSPDVMIVDLGLLWGGGDGVLGYMQESPQWRAIPVIVTTEHFAVETLITLRNLPIAKWMAKPFDRYLLQRCIDTALMHK